MISFDRRTFLKVGAASFASLLSSSVLGISNASAKDYVALTEELAGDIATRFYKSFSNQPNLQVSGIKKYCKVLGTIAGYIVSFEQNGVPSGYVVVDSTAPDLIGEFSFGEGATSPIDLALSQVPSTVSSKENALDTYICFNPLQYGVLIDSANQVALNSGETIPFSTVSTYSDSSAKDPTSWDEATVRWEDIITNYNIASEGYISIFRGISESTVENAIKKYACVVSALYACGQHYGVTPYGDTFFDGSLYNELWDLTNTAVHDIGNGITYGTTQNAAAGPGFQQFCSKRGKQISYTFNPNVPSPFQFSGSINSEQMSVLFASMYSLQNDGSIEQVGHAVTPQSYIFGTSKGGSQPTTYFLGVFDGWYFLERYINYNFDGFLTRQGLFFNG